MSHGMWKMEGNNDVKESHKLIHSSVGRKSRDPWLHWVFCSGTHAPKSKSWQGRSPFWRLLT